MKQFMLASLLAAVSGALISPAVMAQNTDIDDPDHIKQEYRKAMEAERNAHEKGASQADPGAGKERRGIDDPDNISEEYRKAMEDEREAARRKMDGIQGEQKDHLEQRKNIDSQQNISDEYNKAMKEKRD